MITIHSLDSIMNGGRAGKEHLDIPASGHRDIRTSGHRGIGKSGRRDIGTPGRRDIGASGHRDIGASGHQDIGTWRRRGIETSGHRGIGTSEHRNIRKARWPFISHRIPKCLDASTKHNRMRSGQRSANYLSDVVQNSSAACLTSLTPAPQGQAELLHGALGAAHSICAATPWVLELCEIIPRIIRPALVN